MSSTTKPFFLGIAGGTGSGKSTVANNLFDRLPPGTAVLLDHDSYYRDRSHLPLAKREVIDYDHPNALDNDLLVRQLEDLAAGRSIDVPRYDFVSHTRMRETRRIEPVPVIIVEGMLIFVDERIRRCLDVKIFVETDADVRFLRRARRDMQSRGRTFEQVEDQYYRTVRPMHLKFVEPSRKWADVLVPEGGNNRIALDLVLSKLIAVARAKTGDPTLADAEIPQTGNTEPPKANSIPPPPVIIA